MKTNRASTSHLILTASAAALCLLGILPADVQASPPQYSVTDLGEPSRTDVGYAYGVNGSGQIVGAGYKGGFFGLVPGPWTDTAQAGTPLETSPGSLAFDFTGYYINASGQIAVSNGAEAMIWSGTTLTDLGPGVTYGINDPGQVAGNIGLNAVRWTGTTAEYLSPLGGANTGSSAFGINNSGQVAGNSNGHAVRWTGTTPTDLGPGVGLAINASGQVAGESANGHAMVWTGTTATDLGPGEAVSINDSGDVIVRVGDNNVEVYTGGTMYNLSDLLAPGSGVTDLQVSEYGNSINDLGQIAISGTLPPAPFELGQPHSHALLLTPLGASPVPEPTACAMLAAGAASLLSRRRRSKA